MFLTCAALSILCLEAPSQTVWAWRRRKAVGGQRVTYSLKIHEPRRYMGHNV